MYNGRSAIFDGGFDSVSDLVYVLWLSLSGLTVQAVRFATGEIGDIGESGYAVCPNVWKFSVII